MPLLHHINTLKKTIYFRKLVIWLIHQMVLSPDWEVKAKQSRFGRSSLQDQINLVNLEGHRVVPDVSKPLPLRGPPGQIESEREYNVSAAFGISHWWFKRKEFYITRHSAPFDRFNLWIRNVVIRKHVEYLQLKIESYQTKLNLTQPNWDASNFLFKEDYTIVNKPREVIYRDRNVQKKMMRETRVYKFSDGTLTRILEKMDYMVKDFRLFKYNPGMENRIWSEDDKRRSKEFMEVIERRLKIRRIFRSLECFMSGRSDTYTGNPVKELLLKLNLPDHGSVLTDLEVQVKMEMEIPRSNGVNFITACSYLTDTSKDIMKAQVYVSKLPQL
ncbi:hypothetical protein Tco_1191254 [Tanacetum coccineum]